MAESRIKNTKRNIVASYMFTLVSAALNFLSRFFIARIFGEEYLGLSSLFVSVLQVLSVAELGFSSAMVFNMYKPLAEKDTAKVNALLNYYKSVYRIIGFIVLGVGTFLLPFIPKLIYGSVPENINIYVLYYLYLINSAISYFLFAYKSSLLEAMQKNYLVKTVYSVVTIVRYGLQIVSVVVLKNYYLFVICLVLGTAFMNFFSAVVAKRKFPEYFCSGRLSSEVKKSITTRVKGLLVGIISGKTYQTFDSIIISAFIGLSSVAIYNNYFLIYATVMYVLQNIYTSMQASVGNSVAVESVEKNYNDMLLFQFLFSGVALVCVTCMFTLYQPFMTLWMGRNMLLPLDGVVFFCGWFCLTVTNYVFGLYTVANGLWWEMKYSYIFSTVFNIIMNIVLGKTMGISGITLASLLANLIFGLFWQCGIVFRCYFKMSSKRYVIKQFYYFFQMAASCFIAYNVSGFIKVGRFSDLIVKGLLSVVVSVAVLFVANFKTQVFGRAWKFVLFLISKRES